MEAREKFLQIIEDNRAAKGRGIYAVCSAHPQVLLASMQQAKEDESLLLIESTSNQVNQFGGYTDLTPEQFVSYVHSLAQKLHFPRQNLLLGGDHLGPNPWKHLPAAEAMKNACELIKTYVQAGYQKIHLDASMQCADDTDGASLAEHLVASRAAELCSVAESTWQQYQPYPEKPLFVIGTEVPVPGGAFEKEETLQPTSATAALQTIELTRSSFLERGLKDAWTRVVATVVQPGVEFGDDYVIGYKSEASVELSQAIMRVPQMVYEAHSTDYQSEAALSELVKTHYCILKVGPWLTFALREALFALADIEKELFEASLCSHLKETLEEVMLSNPGYWKTYYAGDEKEVSFKRKYSFSDRIRYYWNDHRSQQAVQKLRTNLQNTVIPLSLISQYFPQLLDTVLEKGGAVNADQLIFARIKEVLAKYARACRF